MAWIAMQNNTPGPQEYYLMQIAKEVRSVLSSKPQEILLDHFKIEFKKELEIHMTKRQETRAKKAFSQTVISRLKAMANTKPKQKPKK